MIEERQEIFKSFMEQFNKLDIKQKNMEIVDKQKIILSYLMKYATENGIQFELLKSNEINKVEDNSATNEDYLAGIMVYTHNIEDLISLIIEYSLK